MRVRALVLDMDGTLLDTMPDLAVAANEALTRMGFPTKTQDEMLEHMGRGGRLLIERIVPADASVDERQRTFELWRKLYIGSDYALTRPYDGMLETLHALKGEGFRLGVLSNKFDAGVRALAQRHFPGVFEVVRGDAPPAPRKPDPSSLLGVIDELGARADGAAYVGDSVVDVQTARNAGTKIIGVSWGYDSIAPLPCDDLDAYIRRPEELLSLCAIG